MSQQPNTYHLAEGHTVVVTQTQSLTFTREDPGPTLCGILSNLDGMGRTHHLSERTSIGRGPQCNIQLQDDKISAVQCIILKEPDGMILEDRSTNGTYLNGEKVGKGRRFRLRSGDEISFVLLKRKRRRDNNKVESEFLANYSFQAYVKATHTNFKPLAATTAANQKSIKNWQLGGLIGEGGYSKVYQGLDADTGEMIAVKTIEGSKKHRGSGGAASPFNDPAESVDSFDGSPPRAGEGDTIAPVPAAGAATPSNPSAAIGLPSVVSPMYASDKHEALQKNLSISDDPAVANELNLLQLLSHPKIVQFYGYQYNQEEDCWRLLLEYVSGGALSSLIAKFGSFCENVVRLYALQILQGLEYLHANGVVHGDIKPANILVTDKGGIKISDFGTSKLLPRTPEEQLAQSQQNNNLLCGTPFWMSPELIQTQRHTFASDIWAFGCVVLEMATGHPPWEEVRERLQLPAQIVYHLGNATCGPSLQQLERRVSSTESASSLTGNSEWFSPLVKDFIQDCFKINAEERPTAADLLKHPFFWAASQQSQQQLLSASNNNNNPFLSQQQQQSLGNNANNGHFDPNANLLVSGSNDQLPAMMSSGRDVNPLPSPSTLQEHVQFLSEVPVRSFAGMGPSQQQQRGAAAPAAPSRGGPFGVSSTTTGGGGGFGQFSSVAGSSSGLTGPMAGLMSAPSEEKK